MYLAGKGSCFKFVNINLDFDKPETVNQRKED